MRRWNCCHCPRRLYQSNSGDIGGTVVGYSSGKDDEYLGKLSFLKVLSDIKQLAR